jgi:acyl-coenzyme A synthetase/AMP-(fatty) acid ligase
MAIYGFIYEMLSDVNIRSAIHTTHPRTVMCCNGADRKQKRIIAKEDARQATEHLLMALGKPLESVSIFKYLGRLLSSNDDDDWLAGSP